jgi:broad specificity phosphatase PhoE
MIRHGRPEWHPPCLSSLSQFEYISADYDAAHLSGEGRRAVDALAEELPPYPILSSDLLRARETATILGRTTNVIGFDSSFRELQAPRIVSSLIGKLLAPWIMWSAAHGCCWILGIGQCPEWPRAAWSRATQAANKILAQSENKDGLILVSHGWFLVLLTLHLRWRGMIEHGPFIPRTGYGAATQYYLRTSARPSQSAVPSS